MVSEIGFVSLLVAAFGALAGALVYVGIQIRNGDRRLASGAGEHGRGRG